MATKDAYLARIQKLEKDVENLRKMIISMQQQYGRLNGRVINTNENLRKAQHEVLTLSRNRR